MESDLNWDLGKGLGLARCKAQGQGGCGEFPKQRTAWGCPWVRKDKAQSCNWQTSMTARREHGGLDTRQMEGPGPCWDFHLYSKSTGECWWIWRIWKWWLKLKGQDCVREGQQFREAHPKVMRKATRTGRGRRGKEKSKTDLKGKIHRTWWAQQRGVGCRCTAFSPIQSCTSTCICQCLKSPFPQASRCPIHMGVCRRICSVLPRQMCSDFCSTPHTIPYPG